MSKNEMRMARVNSKVFLSKSYQRAIIELCRINLCSSKKGIRSNFILCQHTVSDT